MRSQLISFGLHAAGALAQVTETISNNDVTNTIVSIGASGEVTTTTQLGAISGPSITATNTIEPITETLVSVDPSGNAVTTTLLAASSTSALVTATAAASAVAVALPNPSAPPFLDAASSSGQLNTFMSVLQQDRFSGLALPGTIFTCLAPNDAAFEAFLSTENGQRFQEDDEYATQLLKYHIMLGVIDASGFSGDGILGSEWYRTWYYRPDKTPDVDARVGGYTDEGGSVKIVSGYLNTATVQQANVEFQGGYIHIIDQVLTIPPSFQDLLTAGNFTSLLGAFGLAEQAGLGIAAVEELNQPTIFAPTNEAFQNIGSALGSLSAQDVADILMYHVVETPIFASDLEDGATVQTLGGGELTVSLQELDDGLTAFVNGAEIVLPNLVLLEGVAHGIDQVLNPNNMTTIPDGAESGVVQYGGAMAVDSPPLTSGLPAPTTTISLPEATGSSSGNSSSSYGMPEQQIGNGAAKKGSGAVVLAVLGAAMAAGL